MRRLSILKSVDLSLGLEASPLCAGVPAAGTDVSLVVALSPFQLCCSQAQLKLLLSIPAENLTEKAVFSADAQAPAVVEGGAEVTRKPKKSPDPPRLRQRRRFELRRIVAVYQPRGV